MCEWGVEDPATWSGTVGNSWRTTGDISDNWRSMVGNLNLNDRWWNFSGPGHWNDPDMLEVGNGGMTNDEYQAHFSLWALIKSPLLIGCDVTKMSPQTAAILTNAEVIALSQDDLGVQGHRVIGNASDPTGQEVWAGPLANGDVAVILFNKATSAVNISPRLPLARHARGHHRAGQGPRGAQGPRPVLRRLQPGGARARRRHAEDVARHARAGSTVFDRPTACTRAWRRYYRDAAAWLSASEMRQGGYSNSRGEESVGRAPVGQPR